MENTTLLEYCNYINQEIEVWDNEVEVGCPIYIEPDTSSEYYYHEEGKEHDLNTMMEWFMCLEVKEREGTKSGNKTEQQR